MLIGLDVYTKKKNTDQSSYFIKNIACTVTEDNYNGKEYDSDQIQDYLTNHSFLNN